MIFVFGSNLAGFHGKDTVLHAKKYYGAEQYIGVERTGNAYAIPTKDAQLKTLPLTNIRHHVNDFIWYAIKNPDLQCKVTRIGCSLAGYCDHNIAPMFRSAPENCLLPNGWKPIK